MKKLFILLALISFTFQSCGDKSNSDQGLKGFSNEVLKNWAENIIYPSYQNYQNKIKELTVVAGTFEETPTEINFTDLKNKCLEAYKAYQRTIIFDIYEAEKTNYTMLSNSYPTTANKTLEVSGKKISLGIENNIELIEEGKADEISLSKKDVITAIYKYQGFPALDYLLFSSGKDLNYYQNDKAPRTYIRMLSQGLETNINKVVDFWKENKNNYANNSDQSITGAYSRTVNAFVRIYESRIRAEKVGYACGAIPVQNGVAITNNIEAYYNPNPEVSKELLKIALQSSQDFFNGKHFNSNQEGKSLKSILKELGRNKLIKDIEEQYKQIYKTLDGIPNSESLKDLAANGNSNPDITKRALYPLFLSIQKNVGNFKRRMLQEALNVQIDYVDGDGD